MAATEMPGQGVLWGEVEGIEEMRIRTWKEDGEWKGAIAVLKVTEVASRWVWVFKANLRPLVEPKASDGAKCRELMHAILMAGYAAKRARER